MTIKSEAEIIIEEIEKGEINEEKEKTRRNIYDNYFLEMVAEHLFEHQIKMKLYHFQTKKYGAHKASDEYIEKFRSNFDRLIEIGQGIFGTLQTQKISFDFESIKDYGSVQNHLDKTVKFLR